MSKTSVNAIQLFPISMSERAAYNLIMQHAQYDYETAVQYHYGNERYCYHAYVHEDGQVDLSVWYSYDHGMIRGSGVFFEKKIKPFTQKQVAKLLDEKKFQLAEEEYNRRKQAAEFLEIEKIKNEMFGG